MKCFGTCLFLRALWADVSGEIVPIHIRTDANNLVTTAKTTHLPEQKETHHLIQMLRHESNTGHLDDLSHVASEYCLADPLLRQSFVVQWATFWLATSSHACCCKNVPYVYGNVSLPMCFTQCFQLANTLLGAYAHLAEPIASLGAEPKVYKATPYSGKPGLKLCSVPRACVPF